MRTYRLDSFRTDVFGFMLVEWQRQGISGHFH